MKRLHLLVGFCILSSTGFAQIKLDPSKNLELNQNQGNRTTTSWIQYSQTFGTIQLYAFMVNTRHIMYPGNHKANVTTMGCTIDTLVDWGMNSFPGNLPVTIDTLAMYLLHVNHSGTNDTIIVRILDADQQTGYPTNSVLWADTMILNQSLFPGQSFLNPLDFTMFTPNIAHLGKFHYDVQYYGAQVDSFGVVLSMTNCAGTAWNGNDDPFVGTVYRKTHCNSAYQPDLSGYDSAYFDVNANLTFDPWGCEFSPFVYMADAIHINLNHGTIQGTVYYDANSNGAQDVSETGIPNIMVHAGTTSALSDYTGHYTLLVDTGSYTLSATPPVNFGISQTPGIVTVAAYGNLVGGANVGLITTNAVNDLEVLYTAFIPPVPGQQHPGIINVINSGSTVQSPVVKMIHPSNAVLIETYPVVSSISGDTLIWNLPPQNPFINTEILVVDSIPTVLTTGNFIAWPVTVDPIANDAQPVNNTYAVGEMIVGSYDPNDKTPNPLGTGVTGDIPLTTPSIDYTIRFQNTGTYYAFNIKIVDTIDTHFDINSLEVLSTSHSPYEVIINPDREVIFKFPGIMLPDSNMNEPLSHGFVRFRLNTNPSQPLGTVFNNTGYIYFDYNEPVITNTTVNTLDLPDNIIESENGMITVYPNPSNGMITVNYSDEFTNGWMELSTPDGKKVVTTRLLSRQQQLNHVANGLYLLTLYSNDYSQQAHTRVVIRK